MDKYQETIIRFKKYKEITERASKLEKALDKACDELNYFQHKLYETEKILYKLGFKEYSIPDDIKARDFYEWKEWLLKDE